MERSVNVEVKDDGVGFAPEGVTTRGGLGLIGMKERVEALRGRLEISSSNGAGTTVRATIPVDGKGFNS
jgi:signal transduction histidine kinase